MILLNSFYPIHNKAQCFFNIIFFIIDEPLNSIGSILKEQVVLGFPGAGGSFINQNTLDGRFMKNIFMGFIDNTTNKNRYDIVTRLFENASFGISEKKDMRNWLWFHVITNASLMAAASKVGSLNNLIDSKSAFKDFALILRELIPLMRTKGSKVSTITNIAMKLALAKGDLIVNLFEAYSEKKLIQLTFIIDFSKESLLLCKVHRENPD